MTNLEIAKVLATEARAGRLEPEILIHFVNSLQYGGPVSDPKGWIEGIASSLPDVILSDKGRRQLKDIAKRWGKIEGVKTAAKAKA